MNLIKAQVIHNKDGQTLLLPDSATFPANVESVDVAVLGNSLIISPEGTFWEQWFEGETVTEDFMVERYDGLRDKGQKL